MFNERFTVPFTLEVSNQEDVILKGTKPEISFGFKEDAQPKPVDRKLLLEVLSQGEKRALYILNILFEINARRKQGQETLVIADDIADSFDYKNKYAIVEYLKVPDWTLSAAYFSLTTSISIEPSAVV
jgi:wobble nucleotide-excising tRNase